MAFRLDSGSAVNITFIHQYPPYMTCGLIIQYKTNSQESMFKSSTRGSLLMLPQCREHTRVCLNIKHSLIAEQGDQRVANDPRCQIHNTLILESVYIERRRGDGETNGSCHATGAGGIVRREVPIYIDLCRRVNVQLVEDASPSGIYVHACMVSSVLSSHKSMKRAVYIHHLSLSPASVNQAERCVFFLTRHFTLIGCHLFLGGDEYNHIGIPLEKTQLHWCDAV